MLSMHKAKGYEFDHDFVLKRVENHPNSHRTSCPEFRIPSK